MRLSSGLSRSAGPGAWPDLPDLPDGPDGPKGMRVNYDDALSRASDPHRLLDSFLKQR